MTNISRREFLRRATIASAGVVAAVSLPSIVDAAFSSSDSSASAASSARKKLKFSKGSVVLFQGDSITDNGRNWGDSTPNAPAAMGYGYASMIAADLLLWQASNDMKIYNKGISGNRIVELHSRWQADCLDIKPDILSILIGVNDYWHTLSFGYKGTAESYRRDYLSLIEKTKDKLPDVQLVICEPFVLKESNGAVNDSWFPGILEIRAAAKEVAQTNDAIFVPFQSVFDAALKQAPATYWSYDGVHTSMAGSRLMATAWLKATGQL